MLPDLSSYPPETLCHTQRQTAIDVAFQPVGITRVEQAAEKVRTEPYLAAAALNRTFRQFRPVELPTMNATLSAPPGRRRLDQDMRAQCTASSGRHNGDDPDRGQRDRERDRDQQNLHDRLEPLNVTRPGVETVPQKAFEVDITAPGFGTEECRRHA